MVFDGFQWFEIKDETNEWEEKNERMDWNRLREGDFLKVNLFNKENSCIFAKKETIRMCDVKLMTSRITRLSRRGFEKRLKLSMFEDIKSLKSYNQQIEKLVDDTYDVFQEIGEPEWNALKEPLEILISTTQDLLKAYKRRFKGHEECDNLEGMLSYLKELRSDILNFRLPCQEREEWNTILDQVGKRMKEKHAS